MAWFRLNQNRLRTERRDELEAFVHAEPGPGARCGRPVILPGSYPGSPRNMYNLYLDALAIIRVHGRPDYFITFTANPLWAEITQHLLHGQRAADRPDLVARVFHLKLPALIHDLTILGVLGDAVAWTWVVEFQKRGLPHAHILLVVAAKHKPRTAEDIDARVTAELPLPSNRAQDGLAATVRRCMLHGPCGARNPAAPCMREDRTCRAGYPKDFRTQTFMQPDAYPAYRRRDQGVTAEKNGVLLDNRDVVPYSPYLLHKYNAHLNVEVVTGIRLVKYMYKYAFKGHDRASITVDSPIDEIQEHLDARYVGASEAAWRLFEFPIHGTSHMVSRLHVHLPNENPVTFSEGDEAAALAAATSQLSTLTAWFKLNSDLAAAGPPVPLLARPYNEVPLYCTWQQKTHTWQLRKNGPVPSQHALGRMPPVSPTEGERYFLYLLLLHTPGARSYTDLRTVADTTFDTFQLAATARGLCDSDDHYHEALAEVLASSTPARARRFLATLLACCDVADGASLWQSFADDLAQDFRLRLPHDLALQAALGDLQHHLSRHGKSNGDFHISLPNGFDHEAYRLRELRAELQYNPADEAHAATSMRQQMNAEQAQAYDAALSALEDNVGRIFYVDGPGGTGKSFLLEALLHFVRGKGHIAVACAWSGLAASLLPGGRTCHARFGFPVPLPRDHVPWNITARSGKGQLLARAQLLIWDEVGTASAAALDAADECLRDICSSDAPFGGKVVLLAGDLRQTLPVVPFADRDEIIRCSVPSSRIWKSGCLQHFCLTQNLRAASDPAFSAFLLRIGDGSEPYDLEHGASTVHLPAQLLAPLGTTLAEFLAHVYGDIASASLSALQTPTTDALNFLATRAILAPKHEDVNALNDAALGSFPAATHQVLHATTYIPGATAEDLASFPAEYLDALDLPGLPPARLAMCPGAVVMLVRNIDYENGLCNGTRALVVSVSRRSLDILVLTGRSQGHRAFLPRIPMTPSEYSLPVRVTRRQFPVRLAWAITINKAQGQTLQRSSAIFRFSFRVSWSSCHSGFTLTCLKPAPIHVSISPRRRPLPS